MRAPGELLLRGAICGLLGGLATGAIDALWSWQASAQFAAGVLGRLRVVGFCASSYGLAGALAGAMIAAAALLLGRGTRLGELARHALQAHDERRRRDPGEAVIGLSLVLVGLPALALAGRLAHRLALPLLARRNPELVVATIMLAAVGALLAAVLAAFVLGRQLERPLAQLARRPRWSWLSSPAAPAVAAAIGAALLGGALLVRGWETARQLPLRPAFAALGLGALAVASWPAARRGAQALALAPPRRRLAATGGVLAALLALLLGAGASPSTIKAVTAYSGLGGAIARLLRGGLDRDRDGYSGWLGGGDCDDGDARVHPGAAEVPGDGVDQNCVAGDAPAAAPAEPGRDLALAPLPEAVPRDANILLVTIDTLRADHLGAYGYRRATSPAIDQLAREGTLFEHGWAHAPSTRYSMPAILTGRLPLDVRYDLSVQGWPGLAQRATTIAEVLRPLGFATGAITNYWYFDRSRGMDQGFDEYDNDNARLHTGVPGAGPAETAGSSAREQTDKAIQFVERHAGGRWFLWVHYYDPHYAYEAHPGSPSFGGGRVELYDGEIRFTDEQLGRLLETLRQRGLYDRTIVAVTGDHGEGFGEHGIELHGYHLYAAQTRVPMIVRVPGLAARRSATPAGHIDLLPTLANLGGIESESAAGSGALADAMGRSLVDVLAGAPDRDRPIWQQLSYEGNHELRGAASQACHVLYNVSPAASWEVYRLDEDRDERRDLADTSACAAARGQLARWYDAAAVPPGAAAALLTARPPLDGAAGGALEAAVELGGVARLWSVQLPARARAGETVPVRWTFEALGTPPPGWRVFVHVDGPLRWNADHAPARPPEWWREGQLIGYTTQLEIPRAALPGSYAVWAGLWNGRRRMPIRGARVRVDDNRAQVATFEVLP